MVKLIFGTATYTIHGLVQRVPADRFALAYGVRNPYGEEMWAGTVIDFWSVANDFWGATA